MGWKRELRGLESFGVGELVYGRNIEKKVWKDGYPPWEILRGSKERTVGIFDLWSTLRHEKKIYQAGKVGPSSLKCEDLAIRRGYPAKFLLSFCCGLMEGTSTELFSACSLHCRTAGHCSPESFPFSSV